MTWRFTATGLEPEPAELVAVLQPYIKVGPYSKKYIVSLPRGLIEPFRMADEMEMDDAGWVVTSGAGGPGLVVVKVRSAPYEVPPAFTATMRK